MVSYRVICMLRLSNIQTVRYAAVQMLNMFNETTLRQVLLLTSGKVDDNMALTCRKSMGLEERS